MPWKVPKSYPELTRLKCADRLIENFNVLTVVAP